MPGAYQAPAAVDNAGGRLTCLEDGSAPWRVISDTAGLLVARDEDVGVTVTDPSRCGGWRGGHRLPARAQAPRAGGRGALLRERIGADGSVILECGCGWSITWQAEAAKGHLTSGS